MLFESASRSKFGNRLIAEENIWAEEGCNDERVEKTAQRGAA
jgi:hypothetical protein